MCRSPFCAKAGPQRSLSLMSTAEQIKRSAHACYHVADPSPMLKTPCSRAQNSVLQSISTFRVWAWAVLLSAKACFEAATCCRASCRSCSRRAIWLSAAALPCPAAVTCLACSTSCCLACSCKHHTYTLMYKNIQHRKSTRQHKSGLHGIRAISVDNSGQSLCSCGRKNADLFCL